MPNNERHFTVTELAGSGRLLGMPRHKILRLIRAGQLKAVNVSAGASRASWAIPESEVERFIAERTGSI